MRRLSIVIIAAALTGVCAQVALAADMPVKARPPVAAPPPVYNWTGFYVGGHVGYLWGRTRVEEDGVVTEDGVATNGVVGGALAGYNFGSTTNSFLASKAISVGPTRTVLASLRPQQ